MGRLAKPAGKSGGKLKPEEDWRIAEVREIDHWTSEAWEENGVGDRRLIGNPKRGDPEMRAAHDRNHQAWKDRNLQLRAKKLAEAEEMISQLRRKYLAEGRVLKLKDLFREMRTMGMLGRRGKTSTPAVTIGEVLDEFADSPIIRVDQPRQSEDDDVRNPRHFSEIEEEDHEPVG